MALHLGLRISRRIYRDGLWRALERVDGFRVVGATESFTELIGLIQAEQVGCVVLEVHEHESCAVDAIHAIRRGQPTTRIVVLHGLDRFGVHRLKRAGAHADAHRHDGISAVIAAINGATPALHATRPELQPLPSRLGGGLTVRERQVLELVAHGNTSRAISTRLTVSPKTVENHKQRIFRKLEVQSQGEAVAVALRRGLIPAIPADTLDLTDRGPYGSGVMPA